MSWKIEFIIKAPDTWNLKDTFVLKCKLVLWMDFQKFRTLGGKMTVDILNLQTTLRPNYNSNTLEIWRKASLFSKSKFNFLKFNSLLYRLSLKYLKIHLLFFININYHYWAIFIVLMFCLDKRFKFDHLFYY